MLGEWAGEWAIRISRFGVYGMFGRFQGKLIGAMLGTRSVKASMERDPNVTELRKDMREFRKWTEDQFRQRMEDRRAGKVATPPLLPSDEEIKRRKVPHTGVEAGAGNKEREGESGQEHGLTVLHSLQITAATQEPGEGLLGGKKAVEEYNADTRSSDKLASYLSSSAARTADSGTNASTSPAQNPGESKWDAIRRQQHQQAGGGVEREPRSTDSPRSTGSFPFSGGTEERNRERKNAQREFDAQVEREREFGRRN